MQLTDILKPDCIRVPLEGSDKRAVIDELVQLLHDRGRLSDIAAARDAVWQREQTRTTGIGHGLAIPHGKSACCDRLVMAVGKPVSPVEFGSVDGRPVGVLFLLISPPDQTGPHIQALARVSRLMTRADVRGAIEAAPDAAGVWDVIEQQEKLTVR